MMDFSVVTHMNQEAHCAGRLKSKVEGPGKASQKAVLSTNSCDVEERQMLYEQRLLGMGLGPAAAPNIFARNIMAIRAHTAP